ncbi:GNAT family N-acetyltransferase, partial [Streptomyces sp. A7024]
PHDLPTLVTLRNTAANRLLAAGIDQWHPHEMGEDHFRSILTKGEIWLAEADDGTPLGAYELWWDDEPAWGPQPPTAGYIHRLMTDTTVAPPGTGRTLLRNAESRIAEVGRTLARLDCLATNPRLRAYYEAAGYAPVGTKEGKPVAGGGTRSFTLLEKELKAPKKPKDPTSRM